MTVLSSFFRRQEIDEIGVQCVYMEKVVLVSQVFRFFLTAIAFTFATYGSPLAALPFYAVFIWMSLLSLLPFVGAYKRKSSLLLLYLIINSASIPFEILSIVSVVTVAVLILTGHDVTVLMGTSVYLAVNPIFLILYESFNIGSTVIGILIIIYQVIVAYKVYRLMKKVRANADAVLRVNSPAKYISPTNNVLYTSCLSSSNPMMQVGGAR
eukprot:TRINITY_DN1052_c0_g1_i1.p1 TRINITY_DN1052_c0_g1~~TRINITY_DN1052_c0_g1_i1.p1  ORF type:complete len:211 (-),score=34.89 TRINITY_DN1052_c0_g1_i1:58-690(-)